MSLQMPLGNDFVFYSFSPVKVRVIKNAFIVNGDCNNPLILPFNMSLDYIISNITVLLHLICNSQRQRKEPKEVRFLLSNEASAEVTSVLTVSRSYTYPNI
jgi:hypothetical protein